MEIAMPHTPEALVVIAHYDARPATALIQLLDSLRTEPAGWPFALRVVVNQSGAAPLVLPERHRDLQVLYRENLGFNIGAWDFGWRRAPAYERYLFLQDECRPVHTPWLRPFMRRLAHRRVGLIGESWFAARPISWEAQAAEYAGQHPGRENFFHFASHWLRGQGIDPGRHVDHLQSLVLATRREVLEGISGFRIGKDKEEAIAAEIGISRAVAALGLRCEQLGFFPFSRFLHPQWQAQIAAARTKRALIERGVGILERLGTSGAGRR
jgi:hypothetical protein